MLRSMIFIHWKQANLALLPFVVAAFGLPLLSIQGLGDGIADPWLSYQAFAATQLWLPLYPILAAAVGVTLALTAWNWDHQLGHQHALSLPMPRWRYALLKLAAGMALALVPTLAFWVSAHLAAASVTLPEGLRTYPDALAFRFLLAVLVSYAALFAAAAGTVRTTLTVVTAVLVLLFVAGMASDLLVPLVPSLAGSNLADWIVQGLVERPGPFAVFTGNWSLIDV
jgi:hypothetical protein